MKANAPTPAAKGKPAVAAISKATTKAGMSAAAAAAATSGRGPGPGGSSTPIDHTTHRVWDSGELQQQIGSKNKDKKKLVMQVWYEYFQDTATSYSWSVHCRLKAEDKKLIGSGWDAVNKLASVSYSFTYVLGTGAPITKSATNTIVNRSDTTMMLIGGTVADTAQLPLFQSRHVTGSRSGGPSGISLAW